MHPMLCCPQTNVNLLMTRSLRNELFHVPLVGDITSTFSVACLLSLGFFSAARDSMNFVMKSFFHSADALDHSSTTSSGKLTAFSESEMRLTKSFGSASFVVFRLCSTAAWMTRRASSSPCHQMREHILSEA
jgi:hypothetical protein